MPDVNCVRFTRMFNLYKALGSNPLTERLLSFLVVPEKSLEAMAESVAGVEAQLGDYWGFFG